MNETVSASSECGSWRQEEQEVVDTCAFWLEGTSLISTTKCLLAPQNGALISTDGISLIRTANPLL